MGPKSDAFRGVAVRMQRSTLVPDRPSRRQLLQVGGVGALGLALPDLLRAGAVPAADRARRGERSCIFIVQYGGASHIDSLDPKPDAPEDVRGPYRAIPTATPGV